MAELNLLRITLEVVSISFLSALLGFLLGNIILSSIVLEILSSVFLVYFLVFVVYKDGKNETAAAINHISSGPFESFSRFHQNPKNYLLGLYCILLIMAVLPLSRILFSSLINT